MLWSHRRNAAGEGDASSGFKGPTVAAAGEPSSTAADCPAGKLPQIRAAVEPPIAVRPGLLCNDNFPALGLMAVPRGFHAQVTYLLTCQGPTIARD